MYYTSLKKVSTSLKYSKNMDRAFKQAKSEDMAIKPGSGSGDYVLESRGSITFEMLMECKMDCNENIREMAKRKLKDK